MNDELTTEQMKAQGIAHITWEAWGEMRDMYQKGYVWLPDYADSYEELNSEGFINVVGNIGDSFFQCELSEAGKAYYEQWRAVFS